MSLEVTFGPMFSGKTTYLIEKLNKIITVKNNHSEKEYKGLIINSLKDSRAKSVFNLSTHSDLHLNKHPKITQASLTTLDELSMDYICIFDYISIDESQFFEDLVPMVKEWLSYGKHVHCSGLVADTNKERFGDLIELIPLADHVEQKKAICVKCSNGFNKGVFTKRKDNSNQELILVSGKEDYYPVCGEHYN